MTLDGIWRIVWEEQTKKLVYYDDQHRAFSSSDVPALVICYLIYSVDLDEAMASLRKILIFHRDAFEEDIAIRMPGASR
jgi:hypothetical protein